MAACDKPRSSWFSWWPTSQKHLEWSERQLLSALRTPIEQRQVEITLNGVPTTINTVVTKNYVEGSAPKPPLVLIHGFGGGIGVFIKNIDDLAQRYTVYAIDMLGFARSGRKPRIQKSDNPQDVENLFVDSIEKWREAEKLKDFTLVGHSFGGYLSCAYALKHPDHIKHLVLADPWGFSPKPENHQSRAPLWVRTAITLLSPFAPFALLRASGPFGPKLLPSIRPDIGRKYETHLSDSQPFYDYVYHSNVQSPSGENGFVALSIPFGWAKFPLLNRVADIRKDLPITFIYGEHTWMDRSSGLKTAKLRPNSKVDVHFVRHAGHHVHCDNHDDFNAILLKLEQ